MFNDGWIVYQDDPVETTHDQVDCGEKHGNVDSISNDERNQLDFDI